MRIQNSRARKRINWIVTSQSTKQRRRTTTTTQIQIQPEQQIQIQPGTATDTDTSEYASRWSSAWTEQNREGREGNAGEGQAWEQWPSAINVISFDSIKVRPQKTNCALRLRLRLCRQQQSESGTGNWKLRAGNESAQCDPVGFDIVGNRWRNSRKSELSLKLNQQKIGLCIVKPPSLSASLMPLLAALNHSL